MNILGVADNPDASAAVVVDNELVAAVEQERVDRERHSRAFPSGAIDAALDRAGLRARDVDRIAFGSTTGALLRARPELREKVPPGLREIYRGYQSAMRKTGLYMLEQDASKKILEQKMRAMGFANATVELVEHDRAHANAAYRTQGHASALVLTVDTPGDGAAVSVSVADHLQLDRVFLQTALASVATFPRRIARLLGVTEARLHTLAGTATPPEALVAAFSGLVRFVGPGFTHQPRIPDPDPLVPVLAAHAPAEVAAAAEAVLGEALERFVAFWVAQTGVRCVAAAGALLENPRLCGRIATLDGVESFWVYPAAGDSGLSVGAALAVAGTPVRATTTLALGPTFSDDDCYRQLSVSSLPRRKVDDPEAVAAKLLAAGKSVCRFVDGAEFGPRSLGQRSVLFPVHDGEARDRAQRAMRREPAVPVACATLAEAAAGSFAGLDRAAEAARFAAVAFPATAAFAAAYPAAVHADGTALPQVVAPGDGLHALLSAYRARTGRHTIGQASLNLAGQPAACTPNDAIRVWRGSEADALLLGPYLVEAQDRG